MVDRGLGLDADRRARVEAWPHLRFVNPEPPAAGSSRLVELETMALGPPAVRAFIGEDARPARSSHATQRLLAARVPRAFAEVSLGARSFFERQRCTVVEEEPVERRGVFFTRFRVSKALYGLTPDTTILPHALRLTPETPPSYRTRSLVFVPRDVFTAVYGNVAGAGTSYPNRAPSESSARQNGGRPPWMLAPRH